MIVFNTNTYFPESENEVEGQAKSKKSLLKKSSKKSVQEETESSDWNSETEEEEAVE